MEMPEFRVLFYDTVCAKRFSALRRTLTRWRLVGGVALLPYLFLRMIQVSSAVTERTDSADRSGKLAVPADPGSCTCDSAVVFQIPLSGFNGVGEIDLVKIGAVQEPFLDHFFQHCLERLVEAFNIQ